MSACLRSGRQGSKTQELLNPRLGDLADRFASEYLPKHTRPSTEREWSRIIRVELRPALGDVDLTRVRGARARVRAAFAAMLARGGGETAHRLQVFASRVTFWAVSRDLVDSAALGVFASLEKPAPTRARSRVLTDEEIGKVWRAMQDESPRESAFWEPAFRTGQPRGELLGTTFEQFAAPHEWRLIVKCGRDHWLGLPPSGG